MNQSRFVFTLITLALGATSAQAAQPEGKLRLGHYSSADGTIGLVIDRSGAMPLLKFDNQLEVWALTTEKAATNTKLKRDDGHIVIVVGQWAEHQLSVENVRDPVNLGRDADATAIAVPNLAQAALDKHLADAAQQIATDTGAKVTVKIIAGAKSDVDRGLLSTAVDNAVVALTKVGSDDLGKDALKTGIKQVVIADGKAPQAKFEKGVLTIAVSLTQSWAGRPSSAVIKKVIEAAL